MSVTYVCMHTLYTYIHTLPKNSDMSPKLNCVVSKLKELLPLKDIQGIKCSLKSVERHSFHFWEENRINCFRAWRTPENKASTWHFESLRISTIESSRVAAKCQVVRKQPQTQQYLEK